MFGWQVWFYVEAVFSSLTARKNSSFISLETCFDLYLDIAVWKEKVDFKEKHTKSNFLIESFYAIKMKCLCCANGWKKNFDLKNAEISQSNFYHNT